MKYAVEIGAEAERDLESIHDFIAANDGAARAVHALDTFVHAAASLAAFPHRGSHPRELHGTAYSQYRQLIQSPWRMVYRVEGKRVFVMLVAYGRRDLRALLEQRLLGA
ncbi:MAG: type II toxin-antitoxin system RelE/ParE family toxin [Xanthomonadaceae bacterium]|nr:type II toxin-antitoxin system RelE/ParE family toxin [Xanthomonadaceae bacterium]MDE2084074.1 type II toxin-antitoxin system RelE/ParE family toxin [Xanthomonadaceae bacterium]